jgi:hypothetical protein
LIDPGAERSPLYKIKRKITLDKEKKKNENLFRKLKITENLKSPKMMP